jgi:hypothetical protein
MLSVSLFLCVSRAVLFTTVELITQIFTVPNYPSLLIMLYTVKIIKLVSKHC